MSELGKSQQLTSLQQRIVSDQATRIAELEGEVERLRDALRGYVMHYRKYVIGKTDHHY